MRFLSFCIGDERASADGSGTSVGGFKKKKKKKEATPMMLAAVMLPDGHHLTVRVLHD